MSELKTKKTTISVQDFLLGIEDPLSRADCETLSAWMRELTGDEGKMWGGGMAGSTGMVGFGDHHYRGASGRSGVWFATGFSPSKANLTIYMTSGFDSPEAQSLLAQLGRHTIGKGCLYVKRLADVDQEVLKKLLAETHARAKADSDRVQAEDKP